MFKKSVLMISLLSSLLVAVFAVQSSLSVVASSSMIRVPDDYQTIQEAVDTASPGDMVFVSAGTYYEHVRVSKGVLLMGESQETTIIDGNRTGDVLYVTASNVRIMGFTIRNGGGLDVCLACGIVLENSDNSVICSNTIASNMYGGIYLERSSKNLICNNQILNNGGGGPGLRYGVGIQSSYSNSNIVCGNSISKNVVSGISIIDSYDNIIDHNTVIEGSIGVDITASGNIVSYNVLSLNGDGIALSGSGNTIKKNEIFKNDIGIGIGYSSASVVSENNITENYHGITMAHGSPDVMIVANVISKNHNGILIHYSNGSIIHHNNFINNTVNVPEDVYPNVNTWDDDYPSGGNYWSDYLDADFQNGPHQNLTGSDGIGDTPHTLDARNEDRFPLMGPIIFFDAGIWNESSCDIQVISNSTISSFQLNKTQRIISFNVASLNYTVGFCRVTIPNAITEDLWQNNYTVLVDGIPQTINNWTDNTYTYIYFTYLHSQHEIVIIPEFPTATILLLLITLSTITATLTKKEFSK